MLKCQPLALPLYGLSYLIKHPIHPIRVKGALKDKTEHEGDSVIRDFPFVREVEERLAMATAPDLATMRARANAFWESLQS